MGTPHQAPTPQTPQSPPANPQKTEKAQIEDKKGHSPCGKSPPPSRKRGHERKQKMLLKPVPPSRDNGEPNANAIQRFARGSKTYVKMGRVAEGEQIYYISYYLDGKALDFYNQVAVPDEHRWDLERFFVGLFEFCFPVDFRNEQRKRLVRCFQNTKGVAAHVTEIYCKGLDPEVATWDNIVQATLKAEVLVKIGQKIENELSETEYQSQEDDENSEEEHESGEDHDDDAHAPAEQEEEKPSAQRRGGRVETPQKRGQTLRVAAVDVPEHNNRSQADSQSQGGRDEYMRKGLCFNCSGRGHLARDCPSPKSARPRSEVEMDTHAVYFSGSSSHDAYVSPDVLESMYIGSVRFDVPPEVVERGVEPLESWWEPTEIFDTDVPSLEAIDDKESDVASFNSSDLTSDEGLRRKNWNLRAEVVPVVSFDARVLGSGGQNAPFEAEYLLTESGSHLLSLASPPALSRFPLSVHQKDLKNDLRPFGPGMNPTSPVDGRKSRRLARVSQLAPAHDGELDAKIESEMEAGGKPRSDHSVPDPLPFGTLISALTPSMKMKR
ncbi:hypothetical protein C8R47DRAFT_1221915 [Mycena vitilis]|nr:hypothetical protein C8R47DRAFT_1221915 [Mycena vitilis]